MSETNEVFETIDDNIQTETTEDAASDPSEVESESLEQDQANEESSADSDDSKKDPWYKRRIDELTRDKHEARRQAERLEKILEQQEAMMRQYMPQNVATEPQGLIPPDPSQFAGGQYDPRYIDAMMQYTRESAIYEARQAVAAEYQQREQAQAAAQAQARLAEAEAATRAKHADYDAVIEQITSDPRLANNPTIRQALLGMENGPEIAYTLGRNLDVAYQIASMNPIQAGMKLAEIIGTANKSVSKAPPPIRPISATGKPPRNEKSYAEMSTEEYIAARNAEDLARRQAMMKR